MLNEALKLVREFHRMNQTELAEKLQISNSYLSELETGKKKASIDLLRKYSEIFDIPPSSLLMFAEVIENETFAEISRVKIAKKMIKIMNWLIDSGGIKNVREPHT